MLLRYADKRFNAVQLYSLFYALFRITDKFDLYSDFMLFMPPAWQNANLSGLHKDIAFAVKDPELFKDFLSRVGIRTKNEPPVKLPPTSTHHTVQGGNTARHMPVPSDRQSTTEPDSSLLEHVMVSLANRNDRIELPPLAPVTPTHSPPYLSTSPWRGTEVVGVPSFAPGRTPEQEEWYRKRDRHRRLEQSTPTRIEKEDYKPIIEPAVADVHAILTSLEANAQRKKGTFTTWKRSHPDLSIQVPSTGEVSHEPVATPMLSPLTPPPGAEKPELSPLAREVLESASSSPLESIPEVPIYPRGGHSLNQNANHHISMQTPWQYYLASYIMLTKPVNGGVLASASTPLSSVPEIVDNSPGAFLMSDKAEVSKVAQAGLRSASKNLSNGISTMPSQPDDGAKVTTSPQSLRDSKAVPRKRSTADKHKVPLETVSSPPFPSNSKPVTRKRSTADKMKATDIIASSLPSISDSKMVPRKRSTAEKKKVLEETASSPPPDPSDYKTIFQKPSAAGKKKLTEATASAPLPSPSAKPRRTKNSLASSSAEDADVPDALPGTLVEKVTEATAPPSPSAAKVDNSSGKGRTTNNSLRRSFGDTIEFPDALPNTWVPMKRARKAGPGQRTLEEYKQSLQPPSASEISYVGPIYATKRDVLARDSRPYIHDLCGQHFRHPEDIKAHHAGKSGKPGCARKKNKHLAW